MGEILLICSVITLVLLVLFIHKKKEQERQYCNMMRNRSVEDSGRKRGSYYSRDDSAINRISPFRSAGESSAKFECIRNRNMTVNTPRDNMYYDRFNYCSRPYDANYSFNNFKNCVCDRVNCRCYHVYSRGYCTPSNYNYNNNPEKAKFERKDSYFNDLKSENLGQKLEKDNVTNINNQANASNISNNNNRDANPVNNTCSFNQSLNNPDIYLNSKTNLNNGVSYNFNNPCASNIQNIPFNNVNSYTINNNPGYKVIKLEDFLEKEKKDSYPIYKRKNEITLDEVHHSLIKFVKNEVDEKQFSPNKAISAIKAKESNLIKSDDSFLNELIPKKIDFSGLINGTEQKQKVSEEKKLSTPLIKIEKVGFESFGENNEESFKSLKSK
jgi:hypothetical protein